MNPQFIKTLIPSGNPNGLKIIELSGWTGKCLFVPRNKIRELDDREEKEWPGIYILFGTDENSGKQQAYIGESESFYNRIANHNMNKDFWDVAIVFVGDLNRALVKYLEYKLTDEAAHANRYEILNKVQPTENTLSEFDKVAVESYFEQMKFVLSALGYEIFENVEEMKQGNKYYLKTENTEAEAELLENGDMLVYSGALARIRETESFSGWSKNARERFLKDDILKRKDEVSYELTKDTIFKSPSAAAATLTGRPINGWTAWKDKQGKTLDENVRK